MSAEASATEDGITGPDPPRKDTITMQSVAAYYVLVASELARDAGDRDAVGIDACPEDREMIGREVDRRGPDLAQPEPPRHRHKAGESLAHRLVHRPVDLARFSGPVIRIAPSEQQPALLQPPVQPGADVEDHRLVDGERDVR